VSNNGSAATVISRARRAVRFAMSERHTELVHAPQTTTAACPSRGAGPACTGVGRCETFPPASARSRWRQSSGCRAVKSRAAQCRRGPRSPTPTLSVATVPRRGHHPSSRGRSSSVNEFYRPVGPALLATTPSRRSRPGRFGADGTKAEPTTATPHVEKSTGNDDHGPRLVHQRPKRVVAYTWPYGVSAPPGMTARS